jgi:2-oxo-3-hexenedioate decarboxylase
MQMHEQEADTLAASICAASDHRTSISPITDSNPAFGLAEAYAVSARVRARRMARGERPVGWKIGFTNASIWQNFGIHAPIWAPMYDATVASIDAAADPHFSIAALLEPRIEPEIGLRLSRIPNAGMEEDELMSCVDAVTHGFEIVQSIYPEWRTKAPDAVAGFGMHGAYRHGPLVPVRPTEQADWLQALKTFSVTLFRNGGEMDRGVGSNVLGGPLLALRHFVRDLVNYPGHALRAGDLVTTGTLTRAFPVAAGETWSTEISGVSLPPLKLTLT